MSRDVATILLATGDGAVCATVEEALVGRDLHLVTERDFRTAAEVAGRLRPVLILLDTAEAVTERLSICRQIVAEDEQRQSAVILLFEPGRLSPAEALRAGAADTLEVPIVPELLAARVDPYLRLHRMRTELAEAKVSSALLTTAFESSPRPTAISTLTDGRLIRANRAFGELVGRRPEQLAGRTAIELGVYLEPVDRDRLTRLLDSEGRAGGFEVRILDGAGEERLAHLDVELIDKGGERCMLVSADDLTQFKQVERARLAHVALLEGLDRVNRAIQQSLDAEQMLWEVARVTLALFECDRVWLLYPCDPDAPTYRVPVEVTRPECPGAYALDLDVPMQPGASELNRALLSATGPLVLGPDGDLPLYPELFEQFGVRSLLMERIAPGTGKAWVFGMHQCSHPRVWTAEERRLFDAIARRIEDGLASALYLRELRQSEERFRALVEQAADAYFLHDRDGRIVDANQRACESLGYDLRELLAMNMGEVDIETANRRDREQRWEVLRPGASATIDGIHRRKDGSSFPVEVRLGVLQLGGDSLLAAIARDVSERRQAEEHRLAHVRFLENLDRVSDAVLAGSAPEEMMDVLLGTVLDIFQCHRAWLLYPCDPDAPTWRIQVERSAPDCINATKGTGELGMYPELANHLRGLLASGSPNVTDVLDGPPSWDPDDRYHVRAHMDMAIRPKLGKPWQFSLHQCSRGRSWTTDEQRLFKETGQRIADAISSMLYLRDLRESERTYRNLVENQPIGVVIHDLSGKILYVNPTVLKILGYDGAEEMVGKHVLVFVHPDFIDRVTARFNTVFATNRAQPMAEETLLRRDGAPLEAEISRAPATFDGVPAVQVIVTDISERKKAEREHRRLEAQLLRSQKLEAIGQLAGGVAHDFNNILTAILGYVDLNLAAMYSELGPAHHAVTAMEQIAKGAERAATLTRQLLTFSRRDVVRPEVLNLNSILADLDKLLQRLLTENIVYHTILAADLLPVRADAGQMEQVILNLVINAVHAMPSGGHLVVETENTTLDDRYLRDHADARAGRHVLLAVSDTGHGMDATTQDRIFDPFFTTKPVEQGSGLGLATTHGIVKQWGGHIQVYSELGRGTTFKVFLPAASEVLGDGAARGSAVPDDQAAATPATGASGVEQATLLLCEDDDAVREVTASSLQVAGYHVLVTSRGAEALRVAAAHEGSIDLLVTDVIMPDMNGRQLSDALRADRPEIRTLFVSGYTSNVIAEHGVLDEGVEFLEKPFSRERLLLRVRSILAKDAEGGV